MTATISNRRAEESDTANIGRLISQIQREGFGIPIALEDQPDLADIDKFYRTGVSDFWVAETSGRIIGLTKIFLGTTAEFLAAHRFYEKNGFSLIDANDLPERFPRMAVDTRFYQFG